MQSASVAFLPLLLTVTVTAFADEPPKDPSPPIPKDPVERQKYIEQRQKSLFGEAFPTGEDPQPQIPWHERLRKNPDDVHAIIAATTEVRKRTQADVRAIYSEYAYQGSEAVRQKLHPVLQRVEEDWLRFELLLNRLPGTTPEARSALRFARYWLAGGRSSLWRNKLAGSRTARVDFKRRVMSNPNDWFALRSFYWLLSDETGFLVESGDPIAIGPLVDEGQEVVRAVKAHLAKHPEREDSDGKVLYSYSLESYVVSIERHLLKLAKVFEEAQDRRRISAQRVGTQLAPGKVKTWVNGELPKEELSGRIVLLVVGTLRSNAMVKIAADLRTLHTNYGETGLVAFGWITHYSGEDTPEGHAQHEQQLETTAKQFNLPIPVGLQMPADYFQFLPGGESTFQTQRIFAIIGDQQGKIQMVREWNNQKDTEGITALLERLLAGQPE